MGRKFKEWYYARMSLKRHHMYNVWIKARSLIQNTDTIYFQHSYITKPSMSKADIVANAATKLIAAINGNFAAVHSEMEMDALHRLSQVFVNATKKMSGLEMNTPPTEQAQRVEEKE